MEIFIFHFQIFWSDEQFELRLRFAPLGTDRATKDNFVPYNINCKCCSTAINNGHKLNLIHLLVPKPNECDRLIKLNNNQIKVLESTEDVSFFKVFPSWQTQRIRFIAKQQRFGSVDGAIFLFRAWPTLAFVLLLRGCESTSYEDSVRQEVFQSKIMFVEQYAAQNNQSLNKVWLEVS